MGMPNVKKDVLCRLENKTLDAQFLNIVKKGLNCSPFEADAVLDAVKDVYFPFINKASPKVPPGKVTLVAVCADEPSGKSIEQCEKRLVCLTLHRGAKDDRLLQEKGAAQFRRARLSELCQEALSQGALLTREDLAYRVFFVSPRTISRDLACLRKQNPKTPIPLRSTVHDIGPVLSHRVQIVKLALDGKSDTQICRITRHSPDAISNYLGTFVRCAQLSRSGMQVGQISYLLKRSKGLVEKYLELLAQCETDKNKAFHLEEMLGSGRRVEKKTKR